MISTADRLAKRVLPHNKKYVYCNVAFEDAQHLFIGYVVVNIIWGSVLNWAGLHQVIPCMDVSLKSWWQSANSRLQNPSKSKLNSLVMFITWSVWQERKLAEFSTKNTS
jgi:hypothetical protein